MDGTLKTVNSSNTFFVCSTTTSKTPQRACLTPHVNASSCCAPTCFFSIWSVQKQVQLQYWLMHLLRLVRTKASAVFGSVDTNIPRASRCENVFATSHIRPIVHTAPVVLYRMTVFALNFSGLHRYSRHSNAQRPSFAQCIRASCRSSKLRPFVISTACLLQINNRSTTDQQQIYHRSTAYLPHIYDISTTLQLHYNYIKTTFQLHFNYRSTTGLLHGPLQIHYRSTSDQLHVYPRSTTALLYKSTLHVYYLPTAYPLYVYDMRQIYHISTTCLLHIHDISTTYLLHICDMSTTYPRYPRQLPQFLQPLQRLVLPNIHH